MNELIIFLGIVTWLLSSWGLWNDILLNDANAKIKVILVPKLHATRTSVKIFSRFQLLGLFWIISGVFLYIFSFSSNIGTSNFMAFTTIIVFPLILLTITLNAR